MSDGAKNAITLMWIVPIWILIGVIWAISDQSPLDAARGQIEVMNQAYGRD